MVFHQTNRSPAKGGADRLETYATQKLGRTPSRMFFPQANVAMILFVRRSLLPRKGGGLVCVRGGFNFYFYFHDYYYDELSMPVSRLDPVLICC